MARLFLTRRLQKSFERLDVKMQERVKQALLRIRENPMTGKPLTGDLAGQFSLRVGNLRIIHAVEGESVWIETVRHRKDVYRQK